MLAFSTRTVALLVSGGVLIGCSTRAPLAEGGRITDPDDVPDTSSGGSRGSSRPSTGVPDSGGSAGASGGADGGADDACVTFNAATETSLRPADVILAVDQSGSMDLETDWVRDGLNAFAKEVIASGVDMRVVVIAASANTQNSLCVPAPLGSGRCPADENAPVLTRIDRYVHSTDALQIILGEYGNYADALRDTATKHVIVVSDDDSRLSADSFRSAFSGLMPGSQASFFFHAIYSFASPDCGGGYNACCEVSANEGFVYRELVEDTGGVQGDLCEQDFDPVWDAVSESIVESAPLACSWTIPDPPERMVVDREGVDVVVSLDGVPLEATQVANEGACSSGGRQWYFDDPTSPKKVLACPAFCSELQSGEEVSVEIFFGCIEKPPTF